MSDSNSVAIMNQVPVASAGVRAESPLHHADLETRARKGAQSGGVHFSEQGLMGHLTLRCNPKDAALTAAAARVLGVELPLQPLTSIESQNAVVRWISPDEWLISVPNDQSFALETRFRSEMNGHYSLVNSSGGLTVFRLSGDRVIDMLKKGTPVDLHDSEFPVGKVVSTVFAKSGATIRRTGQTEFELVVRRSFADYLWLWIQSASQEFGLVVEA
jgi:sarcosine oxidase subunit gamma